MSQAHLTDADYQLVALVAEREGWQNLSQPPLEPPMPRGLAEQMAVARFCAALPPKRRFTLQRPEPWSVNPRTARIVMVAVCLIALVVCWLVSPERTALGLVGAGVFCLWALKRRRTAGPTAGMPRRTSWSR